MKEANIKRGYGYVFIEINVPFPRGYGYVFFEINVPFPLIRLGDRLSIASPNEVAIQKSVY